MKILLTGGGRMGRMVQEEARQKGWEVLAMLDKEDAGRLAELQRADLVLDFSHPDMLEPLEAYVRRTQTPFLSGTTGYDEAGLARLRKLGEAVPVLYSANYSLGIALLGRMLRQFGPALLEDFEPELVEKHHRQKADAPSGTAILLADALDPDRQLRRVSGREGFCGQRSRSEMGMFSVRGGTVAGEHTLYFFGEDETITLSHTAASRRIFAAGAVKAGSLLVRRSPGFYTLEDILFASPKEERTVLG